MKVAIIQFYILHMNKMSDYMSANHNILQHMYTYSLFDSYPYYNDTGY